MADRNLVLQLLITARDQASAGLDRVRNGLSAIASAVSESLAPLRTFTGLLGAALGVGGAKELVDRADAFTRLSNRLRAASKDEEDYRAALADTVTVARATNSELDSTAALYGRVKLAADDLRITQQQVAEVTSIVAKGMQLSGAATSESAGATLQFTQALASGVLRGDEFNSVMEASPALIQAIADGLGIGVGEMRALAEAGQLTASRIVQSLLSQKQAIDETYGKLPQTAGQAFQQLSNAATLFTGRINEQLGATRSLAGGLQFLAQNLDAVGALAGAGIAAAFARGTAALVQNTQAALAARAAAQEQAIAAGQQQAASLAAAQGHVAAAQAAYNRALAEQRLAQAQLVALEALAGLFASEEALTAARAQATAAAQAATAATQRYTAAQAALNALQAPAAASAGLFARALGVLTGPAGLILTAVASFGLLYSAFSRQKPVTDELKQSTEQYAAALGKMSAAQTQVELNRVNDALAEQRQRVDAARQAYEQAAASGRGWIVATEDLGPILGTVNRVITDAAEIARIQAERQAKLDAETQALAETEARRAQVLEALTARQHASNTENTQAVVAALQQQAALDKAAKAIQDYAKYLDDLSAAQQKATQTALDRAKADGDVVEIERLSIQLARQRAEAAQQAAELARGEASAAQLKVAALAAQEAAQGRLAVADAAALDQARQLAAVKQAEADAAQAVAEQLGHEAAQTEKLRTAQATLLEGAGRVVAAQQASAEAAVREAQAALELAQARGDENAIAQATLALRQREVEVSQAARATQQAELEILRQKKQQLIDSAGGYERLNAAQRLNVAELDQAVAAKQRDINATGQQIEGQQREAQQAAVMAGPIGQLSRLYAQQTAEHERAADASERYYQTQLNQIDGAIRVARARGDEAEVADLLQQRQQILIDQADAKASADAQAVEDAEKKLEAYKLEASATDGVDQAEKEHIQTLEDAVAAKREAAQQSADNANATREEARANEEAAAAAKEQAAAQKEAAYQAEQEAVRVAEKVVYAAQNFDQLSEKGQAALKAIGTGYETAHGSIEQLNRAILEETQALDGAAGAEIAAAERLERLIAAAQGVGPAAERAQEALGEMGRGGTLGIQGITVAGEQALQKLRALEQQAQSTRAALRDMADGFEEEILRIEGRQRELLEREHQANLERLAELRRQGGSMSEAEYQEAVRRANALHKLRLAQLREEEQARGGNDGGGGRSRSSGGISGGGGVSSGGSSGGGTTNITINVDGKDLLSEEQVRKKIIPAIDRATRLRK
ncbi:MAG: tape measure protein [Candidatus Contendobacter sp.]|nr:tape measure protein [Candidatus Contendobacter sp.]MDG4556061.1 tape measure protein [Candidatus Contendobacter sp.]